MSALRARRRDEVKAALLEASRAGTLTEEILDDLILRNWPRGEKVISKDIKIRTFIGQENLRNQLVSHVYDITYGSVRSGQDNLVVVDDSIVRGTTQRQLTRMLREAGATEVHLRITSPPVKWSCFYGIDTGDRTELLASALALDEIREYLNVDTLAYVHLDRLVAATGAPGAGFCDACFTGTYPVPVPVTLRKHVLEGTTSPPAGTPVQTTID
jgi:amidophosphoribosyltransferase